MDLCRVHAPQAQLQKVTAIENKLDNLYAKIASGDVPHTVVDAVHGFANDLRAGQTDAALAKFKQLTNEFGMDEIGQAVAPLKSIVSIVSQKVKRREWNP